MKTWKINDKSIHLERYPFKGAHSHQAWDSADEWIAQKFPEHENEIIIIGEAFGALSTLWGKSNITIINDSQLSLEAAKKNRENNKANISGKIKYTPITSLKAEKNNIEKIFIRLPKNLELLELYIQAALSFSETETEIWIGGMDKRWNRGVLKITEQNLETVKIFPFYRHSRWIQYRLNTNKKKNIKHPLKTIFLEKYKIELQPALAVFNSGKLDQGAETFLESLPIEEISQAETIADIGCGSGVLGLSALRQNPSAKLIFTDESYAAIQATENNFILNFKDAENIKNRPQFKTANGLTGIENNSLDLILCNPPFHFKNIQTREVAAFMFEEAKRCLKKNGMLQIVGNNHLGYHKLLKDFFDNVSEVNKNDKFRVFRAT
ncbi:MAG: methyltransferase [Spirochaetales bacterium]|nr:methyltransferase [Spirochaetales bacterium]